MTPGKIDLQNLKNLKARDNKTMPSEARRVVAYISLLVVGPYDEGRRVVNDQSFLPTFSLAVRFFYFEKKKKKMVHGERGIFAYDYVVGLQT